MRWIGVRSYGIYLWHYPIIVLTTPANSTDSLARGALQVAASIVVAALSWHFVEEPIRHGALERWWTRAAVGPDRARPAAGRGGRAGRGRRWPPGPAVLGLAGACLAGLIPAVTPAATSQLTGSLITATPRNGTSTQQLTQPSASQGGPGAKGKGQAAALAPRSSCRSVVHIGDSTSDGLNSPNYLPNRALRLSTQYGDVGVRQVTWEISGGRSIVETLQGQPNAATVAQRLIRHGYHGCWVLALGTNDTADVFVGSNVGVAQRIQRMMAVIGNQPVMWVNVVSLLHSGPYSEHDMRHVGPGAAAGLPALPEHARLRLGRRWPSGAGSSPTASTTPRPVTRSAPATSPRPWPRRSRPRRRSSSIRPRWSGSRTAARRRRRAAWCTSGLVP